MIIGLSATFIALVIGSIIGSVAAVVRKWISEVIMRIMDIIMAVPGIAMAAVMVLTDMLFQRRKRIFFPDSTAVTSFFV